MERSREMFERPHYIHIVRHPVATLHSSVEFIRDIMGFRKVAFEEIEQDWIRHNLNCVEFLGDMEATVKLFLKFEDLVTSPEATTRAICENLLKILWEHGMANPYQTSSLETLKTTTGQYVAIDPKVLHGKKIEAKQRDKWRRITLPVSLAPATIGIAEMLGYHDFPLQLPPELVWIRPPEYHSNEPPLRLLLCVTGGRVCTEEPSSLCLIGLSA